MPRRVLIAGAGVAGLEAALALRDLAEEQVEAELLAPETEFVYRPLSVAEPFRVGEARRFPLRRLADAIGVELTRGSVHSVDSERRLLTTTGGAELAYDSLLLALGAVPVSSIPGAVTFRGPGDEGLLANVLEDARAGRVGRLIFALPVGTSWPLPLYELALLSAVHLADAGAHVELELVTPELRPLELFGSSAADMVADLLRLNGITLRTDAVVVAVEGRSLRLVPEGYVDADRVVALPRLEGPRVPGIPHDANGFVPTDDSGRVLGCPDVFAAGDLTDFPVKQGGIAAQQADAAAESIAAAAGAAVEPTPFKPVLRGLLLTGMTPRYLKAELGTLKTEADTEPLWWPPAKIVGRYLAPFLASHLHVSQAPSERHESGLEVEVEFDRGPAGTWTRV